MLKKATVLLIVFTLVISFSMTTFASGAEVTECEDGGKKIETPTDPNPDETATENGEGHGPYNP
ncbi:MAG: hypothetical protein ACOCWE_06580, partial [Bacillota bacterium]